MCIFASHLRLTKICKSNFTNNLLLNYKTDIKPLWEGLDRERVHVCERENWLVCSALFFMCVSTRGCLCHSEGLTLLIILFLWAAHHCGTKSLQCPQQTWERSRVRNQVKCQRTQSRHQRKIMNEWMNVWMNKLYNQRYYYIINMNAYHEQIKHETNCISEFQCMLTFRCWRIAALRLKMMFLFLGVSCLNCWSSQSFILIHQTLFLNHCLHTHKTM